jgi:tetratricopeptide (TPR) repeat protein
MEPNRIFFASVLLAAVTGSNLLLIHKQVLAQEAAQKDFYSLFKATLDKYHNEKFDEAIAIANQIRQEYPHEPAGAFGLLATYQTIMRNYRVRLFESEFDSLLNLSIKLAEQGLKKNKKNGINYFYLGCAYGSRSIFYAQRGRWLDAFSDGTKVTTNFNKALAYAPDFYDSHYGLGLYKYWLGAKSKLLRILPFSRDSRQEGIEHIKLAIEKGNYLNIDGMFGLSAAYYNEGEYEKALEVSDNIYKLYPNNPSLLYRRGRILQALNRWQEAIVIFEKLQAILKSSEYQSISFQIDCLYQLAKCHFQLGSYLDTKRLCQNAIILENYCDFSKETDGPIENFADIKKQLHKLNDEVMGLRLTEVSSSSGK